MPSFGGGWSREERADLVVRFRGDSAGGSVIAHGEHWVVDFKTGAREREQEETYREQVRSYREILSGAWGIPVRGFLWYVETGEAVEVGPRGKTRTGEDR